MRKLSIDRKNFLVLGICLAVLIFGIIADRNDWGGIVGGVITDAAVTIVLFSLLIIYSFKKTIQKYKERG